MIIKQEQPWLLWPKKSSHGISQGNIHDVFEGNNDFTLSFRIKVLSKDPSKRTIFAKLPNYFGIDVENDNNNILFIYKTIKDGEVTPKYVFINDELGWDYNFITIRYSKKYNILDLVINNNVVYEYQFETGEEFEKADDAHYIFGAGNFPHNNFNLNYSEYDIDFLLISRDYTQLSDIYELYEDFNKKTENVVGLYNFDEKTDYQVYDFTGNSNFIHSMLDSKSYN